MIYAAEVPAVPEGLDALMPPWAQQLSLISLLVIIVAAFVRDWVVTRSRAEREVEAERRIAEVWKTNFEGADALNKQLTEAFEPVLEGQAALLRAVEALQERVIRQEEREERERWLRNRRDLPE